MEFHFLCLSLQPKYLQTKKNIMAQKKKLQAATFQLPPNTILLLNKYAKKEKDKNNENGERLVTKQAIVNGAILDKVGGK